MNRLRVLANQLNVESDLDNGNAIVPMKTSSSDQLPTTTCIQLKRIDENTLSVVLNRPNRLNAVDFTMREDFHKLLHFLEGSDKIRVVLLSANGKGFCAGLDMSDMSGGPLNTQQFYRLQHDFASIIVKIRKSTQIWIGLIHGVAVGAGFALALACDIRIGTKDVKMNAAMLRLGLGAADLGLSYLLPRLINQSIAFQILLTGEYLLADRAFHLGLFAKLVDKIEDFGAAVKEYQTLLKQVSPFGMRLTKQVVHLSLDSPSFDNVVALEDRNQTMAFKTNDSMEAITSRFEKRDPVFKDE